MAELGEKSARSSFHAFLATGVASPNGE